MSTKRLESVDIWKGVTILSVLVIHTCFWSGRQYLPDWMRHVSLLLDVTVFFFISGFLLQSSISKIVIQRAGRQSYRLIVDFFLISLIVLLLAIVLYYILRLEDRVELNLQTAVFSGLKVDPSGSVWEVLQVYGGSIWFLRVYLMVLLVGSLLLASPLQRWLPVLPVLSFAAFLVIVEFPQLDKPFVLSDTRFLTFYLTIFLSGAFLKKYLQRISLKVLSIFWITLIAISLVIIIRDGGLPDLQAAKFPPSILYLLFSMHSIMIFCLLVVYESVHSFPSPHCRIRIFLSWCGRNSFRIFLWQGVAASIPYFFIPDMLKRQIPTTIIFLSVLIWNVSLSLLLTYGYNHIVPVIPIPWTWLSGKEKAIGE